MENLKLIITTMVFCLLFPVFSFAFTIQYGEPSEVTFDIDPQKLIVSDIYLTEGESHNITFNGASEYYNLTFDLYRVTWKDGFWWLWIPVYIEDGIIFEVRTPASKFLNNWWFTSLCKVKGYKSGTTHMAIHNITILENWDNEYNWSRFITEGGSQVFITPYLDSKNITESIADGIVTVSLARTVSQEENINLRSFVDWYNSLLIGDKLYGMPSFFTWIVRLSTILGLFSVVLVIKELLKL